MRFSLLFLLFTISVFGQNDYPKDYFRSPLDIPLYLSGTFGELRGNHFHTGLDFKTQQKEGLNVYAAADGYVSRIKISTWGYGKAIYITHPNGYTTVYGHLQKASPVIEAYIKKMQYAQKSFEVEMFPKENELVVKKGDVIALSGNSGGSGGPHLHFEFRDSKTEKIINPMFFGFDIQIKDTRPPVINSLVVYPIGDSSSVNQIQKPIELNLSQQKDGSYIAEKIMANGKIGFGVNTYDLFDNSYNKNGVFKVQSLSNGKPFFGYQFDTFGFDEGRYINALIDYPRYKRTGQRVQKLFMIEPYLLSIITANNTYGIIDVAPNLYQNFQVEVSDFNKNKSIINIPIEYSALPVKVAKEEKRSGFFLKARKDNSYAKDNVSVFIPAGTFYEDFYIDFDVKDSILYLHNETVPVHNNMTITFEDKTSSEADRSKMFIASKEGKRLGFNKTTRKGNIFTTYTKDLGQFVLAKDTIAPKISNPNFVEGKWISKQQFLEIYISDNMSGIAEYNGYLNGKWILLEYDYKTKKLSYNFEDNISNEGRNDLKIVVSDNMGNSATFESHFFRSQQQ
ncbi:murein DD-endopeptidase MepM/ murein hydrolase activator NlpD [Flavobacterium sp. 28YEA47A]|uniref:M23 family metallopeptidase n=1 Tax=Flavobacterium sp. 28YEA47A TaxID=3156276 RepID=UPI0035192255